MTKNQEVFFNWMTKKKNEYEDAKKYPLWFFEGNNRLEIVSEDYKLFYRLYFANEQNEQMITKT